MEEGFIKAIPGYDNYFASKDGFIYSTKWNKTWSHLD